MPCFKAETTKDHLVLCHGARFDITSNGYLEKPKPEKPQPHKPGEQSKFLVKEKRNNVKLGLCKKRQQCVNYAFNRYVCRHLGKNCSDFSAKIQTGDSEN